MYIPNVMYSKTSRATYAIHLPFIGHVGIFCLGKPNCSIVTVAIWEHVQLLYHI